MAKAHLLVLLIGGLISSCLSNGASSGEDELRQALVELKQLADAQQARIQQLEGEPDERKLQSGFKQFDTTTTVMAPSIFGAYKADKVPYTVKDSFGRALTSSWIVICGALVMFMQAGFAMVEAGCCRAKNVQNVLLKNLLDVCIGTFGWWWAGWSFAFTGNDTSDLSLKENGFVGTGEFLAHNFLTTRDDGQQEPTDKMCLFFFQWAFCATAATIVSGGVAERVNFWGYAIFSFMMTSFIYPCVVGATWGMGFLAITWMNDSGYIDFAGSGVVHMTGGVGALVGAIIVGPRNGRFDATVPLKQRPFWTNPNFDPHSLPLVVLGTFILWFGWYGFNCGSTLAMNSISWGMLAAQVAMNTTMSAAFGGLTVFLLRYAMFRKYDIGGFCNGILAGLVSITAGCANVETGSAILIGIIGGLIYQGASTLLRVLHVDDVVDAFPVHGAAGAWGVLAAALFDWGFGMYQVSGWSNFKCIMNDRTNQCKGLVDSMGKDIVSSNLCEIMFITVWAGGMCAVLFLPLRFGPFGNYLRAPDLVQHEGFDSAKHSPNKAYDLSAVGVGGGGGNAKGSAI